ncbi:MAG TPA: hypothetical protein VHV30_05325 [Polyangiaceae bacterium]|jgi:hypothetical protein|nr:hypothetical protein [Polyangiaceae bacterium]
MTKLTDDELWDALDKVTLESELEDGLKKTHEEHVRSLEAQGFDVDKLYAQADAFFDKVQATQSLGKEPSRAVDPTPARAPALEPASAAAQEPAAMHVRPLWRRPLYTVPAALALAAGVILIVHAFRVRPVIGPDVLLPEEARAIDLRHQALEACNASAWQKCLDDLDQARVLDPTGDAASTMKELRATAEQGLRDTPPLPSIPAHHPGPDDVRKMPK